MANYAQALGIHNKWAPIVFAVLYFLLMIWYLIQAIRRHRSVYGGLVVFSALRVVAYSLRAAMANNNKDATSKGIGITYAVLYNVGFFSILLSAYNLLRDRDRLARLNRVEQNVASTYHRSRIIHILFHLLIFVAIILGTVGIVYALGNYGHNHLGNGLNSASTYIFLAVMLGLAILTLLLLKLERSVRRDSAPAVGSAHHHLILILVALLLLLRTLFYAGTVHSRMSGTTVGTGGQANEKLWYPLAALAELLVAMLFLVPGLVPLRSLLSNHRAGEQMNAGYPEKNGYAGQTGGGVQPTGGGAAYNNRDSMQTAV
ncbi:hypothetical protein FRB93_004188 [Tulasnella sp. JGI-2019a]|nr:hypothetical protein FRB93_004188 [Tulasnella sp. JGI-2019a]